MSLAFIGLSVTAHAGPVSCRVATQRSTPNESRERRQEVRTESAGPSAALLPRALQHILKGDFNLTKINLQGRSVSITTLSGGLHTLKALHAFLRLRPDLQRQFNAEPSLKTVHANGTIKILFPQSAFTPGARPKWESVPELQQTFGVKTLFPETWSDEEIQKAVGVVYKNGRRYGDYAAYGLTSQRSAKTQHVVGRYKGVKIILSVEGVDQPLIASAYPDTDQDSP